MEKGEKDGDANKSPTQPPKRCRVVAYPTPLPQPPPPQKCPRCQSLDTKFCYYNNYDLAQPRYLCKACKRHWTLGGALRNIPVGGGGRKGRRARVPPILQGESSSLSPGSRPFQPPPPPEQPHEVQFPKVTSLAAMISGISWGSPQTSGSFYPDEIFAAFDGVQTQGLMSNRPLRIGGGGTTSGASANMPTFPGSDFSSMKSQQAQSQPLQFHDQQPRQSDDSSNRNKDKQPMYTPDENLVLPAGNLNSWTPGVNTNNASTSTSNVWNNINGLNESSFSTDNASTSTSRIWNDINGASTSNGQNESSFNTKNATSSTSNLWNNINGASTSNALNESSFNPNAWPNLPDYDPPQ